jgi:hypothetical protein
MLGEGGFEKRNLLQKSQPAEYGLYGLAAAHQGDDVRLNTIG